MLKSISVKGEIYCEYAYLSYDMCFVNNNPGGAMAEYIFSLPKGAVISDMKMRRADKSVVNTTVVTVSHAARMWDASFAGAVLSRVDSTTYMLRFGESQVGESHIRLRLYVGMENVGEERALTLPLARESRSGAGCERYADISLVLHENLNESIKYYSPTHDIATDVLEREVAISTGEIRADRDFCLRISGSGSKSSSIIVYNPTGGNMLCRLYPDDGFYEEVSRTYNKILLVYDSSGSLPQGASTAGRDLLVALAKNFEGWFLVVSSSNEEEDPKSDFCENTDENIFALITKLNNITNDATPLSDMMRYAREYITDDTLPVLICGTDACLQMDELKEEFSDCGFCAVTLGAMGVAEGVDTFINYCGGAREHIFGNDNIADRAKEILYKFTGARGRKTEVYADGEKAAIINEECCLDRGVTVFVNFSGEVAPKRFLIKSQGIEQEVLIDDASVYQSFAPVQLAYAEYVSKCIEKRLGLCDAREVQTLRTKLEEVGIQYLYINSETAFAAMVDGALATVIRTVVPDSGMKNYEAFDGRPSVFGEVDVDISRRKLLDICADVIVRSVRADGAICAGGEVDRTLRLQQTLIAVLALVASEAQEGVDVVISSAGKYLGDFTYGKMSFTDDRGEAVRMLQGFFGGDKTVHCGIVPDLMTAARMIAQNQGE